MKNGFSLVESTKYKLAELSFICVKLATLSCTGSTKSILRTVKRNVTTSVVWSVGIAPVAYFISAVPGKSRCLTCLNLYDNPIEPIVKRNRSEMKIVNFVRVAD